MNCVPLNRTTRLPLAALQAIVALAILIVGCCWCEYLSAQGSTSSNLAAQASSPEIEGFEIQFPAMGTLVDIKLFSNEPQKVAAAIAAVKTSAAAIEATLTDYDPDSEASQLTTIAVGRSVPVSSHLWNNLAASERWYQLSEGAFDASLGNLTQWWRRQRRNPNQSTSLPSNAEDRGWQFVSLDHANQQVQLQRPVRFDFGAIGKGYLVDQIFEQLQRAGLPCCLVNISGNMRCGDPPPDREGWRIEVSPLEKHHPPLRRLNLKHVSIATSGDLWQYFVVAGQRRSHIIDPRTGQSVVGPIAATIIAPSAADADALATAVCVLGPTAGAQLVAKVNGAEAMILEHSQESQPVRYIVTAGFAR